MNHFFQKATLLVLVFNTVNGFAQEPQPQWRWQPASQDNTLLFIGSDTITKMAEPMTDTGNWWTAFGYPQLDSLVSAAMDSNLDVKIARARVGQAQAKRKIALASMYPTIGIEPSFTRQELAANRPNPFGGQLAGANLNSYELPLTLSYELDIFGKNLDNVSANSLVAKANEENRKDILLSVISELAQNYFLLLQLDSENDLLKNTEVTRLSNLEITSTRYGAGLVSQIDVLRAKTELSSVQVQLKKNAQTRSEIELTLATLVGEDPSEFRISHTRIRYLPPDILFREKDSLAESRPDLKAARLYVKSSEKLVRNQKKQLLPSFYLNGAYGYVSGDSGNLIEDDSRTWMAGISASLPIFEGGRKRSEIKLKKTELEETKEIYNQEVLRSYEQVENSFAQLKWVHEQLLAQQEFVAAAIDAANLTNERYRKGLVNYIDVVDADRQVLEAEQLSVQLFGQELVGRVALIRALGITPQTEL